MIRKKNLPDQGEFWVPRKDIRAGKGSGFYDRLGEKLDEVGFGDRAREFCAPFYAAIGPGRPPIDPEVYFKMLVVGYFEGIGSERGIASRCEDSLMIRRFLRYDLTEGTPDHSTLSVIRKRLPKEVFESVFDTILLVLRRDGLCPGEAIGIDSSTMEACASLEKLQHRLSGESYWDYVKKLAAEAGVDTEDAAAVRRFDRSREGRKTSNEEWFNGHDPDAKIGRRKDGACDMLYKPEHSIDLDSGAIVKAELLPGHCGDSEGFAERALESSALLDALIEGESTEGGAREGEPDQAEPDEEAQPSRDSDRSCPRAVVADKGYHQRDEIASLHESGHRVIVPTPAGRELPCATKHPELHAAVKAAAEATASADGVALLKKRGERVERSFAHLLDAGGMRRTTLTGRTNIQKRYLVAAAAFNLSILFKATFGFGTPKQLAAGNRVAKTGPFSAILRLWTATRTHRPAWRWCLWPKSTSSLAQTATLLAAA